MMPKKIVLITGASSTLIQSLLQKISNNNFHFRAISRHPQPQNNLIDEWIIGDLQNENFVKQIMANVSIVLHAAAVTHSSDVLQYVDVNYIATKKLVEAAKNVRVENFIFISSRAAVASGGEYAESKLMAENFIKSNLNCWQIFRPSEIFGTNKNEGIEKIIHDIFYKRFVIYPGGNVPKLYPIAVSDAVALMAKYFNHTNFQNQTITINGEVGYDFHEIISLAEKVFNKIVVRLPIPKSILFFIEKVIRITKLNIGFAPDQVHRLYAQKEFSVENDFNFSSFENYLNEFKKAQNV